MKPINKIFLEKINHNSPKPHIPTIFESSVSSQSVSCQLNLTLLSSWFSFCRQSAYECMGHDN